jgi:hypothetical protein
MLNLLSLNLFVFQDVRKKGQQKLTNHYQPSLKAIKKYSLQVLSLRQLIIFVSGNLLSL